MKLRPTGPTFGLTLRGMLVITALLAVGMAFVGTKVKHARDEQAIADQILRSGGSVYRQYYGMPATLVDRTWFERLIDLDLETQIVQVRLNGPAVTDALLTQLAGLRSLKYLSLENLDVDGTGLAALQQLPELTDLEVANCAISDEWLATVARLPVLQRLSIDYSWSPPASTAPTRTQLTDSGLTALHQLKSLKRLSLGTAKFDDVRLRALSGLAQLEGLDLLRTGITDDGLPSMLEGMTGLRWLSVYDAQISGPGLEKLRDCPRLLSLRLQCPLTDDGLASLAEVPQLEYLQVNRATGLVITDRGLAHLGKLTNLTQLVINGSQFGDDGLRQLAGLTSLTDLRLNASQASFTDDGLAHLKGLTNLKTLTLQGASAFSPAALDDLQRAVPGIVVQP
jgi:internalin A